MAINIGLISEGISEHYIIKYIVERYLEEDDFLINQIQPQIKQQGKQQKQNSDGGWLAVLNYCTEDKFKEILNYNDYIIVQIDTDTCELVNYDVKRNKNDGSLKTDEELYHDICERILKNIHLENNELFKDRIIFVICFDETECWLLPIYYTDKTKCNKNNCIFKLNQKVTALNLAPIPEKDKNSPEAVKTYKTILKNIKKVKEITKCSQYNYGFKKFIEQLDAIKEKSKGREDK